MGDKGNDVITDTGSVLFINLKNGSGIFGNDGDDAIIFSTTATSITADGGSGNDTILGGIVDDNLSGGADDDLITGFAGSNILKGGTGNDTFIYWVETHIGTDNVDGGADTNFINVTALDDAFSFANATVTNIDIVTGVDLSMGGAKQINL